MNIDVMKAADPRFSEPILPFKDPKEDIFGLERRVKGAIVEGKFETFVEDYMDSMIKDGPPELYRDFLGLWVATSNSGKGQGAIAHLDCYQALQVLNAYKRENQFE